MKDIDLRSILLKQFYDRRSEGWLGFRAHGPPPFEIPDGISLGDALRICGQLREAGLIDFNGADDSSGIPFAGAGKINGSGVDVIEDDADAEVSFNPTIFQQTIHASGNATVQAAGHNSKQNQTVTHHVESLIRAIDAAPVSGADKKEAKSKLGEFVKTPAAATVVGTSLQALLKMLGL
jgi:hypothetical protein